MFNTDLYELYLQGFQSYPMDRKAVAVTLDEKSIRI
jgi:hypothetical protein